MTSKLIDKLTKFCFHSASPPTPLRLERGVITEINLSLGITKPNSISFTAKFCLYFTPSLYLSLCHSVFKKIICLHFSLCHSVSKKSFVSIFHYVILSSRKSSISICHYVILSSKIPVSSFVPLLFCLKKIICLYPSLCYSVFKKSSVSICHYVILSQKYPLSSSVSLLFCLSYILSV